MPKTNGGDEVVEVAAEEWAAGAVEVEREPGDVAAGEESSERGG